MEIPGATVYFPPELRDARSSPSEVYYIGRLGGYDGVAGAVFTERELVGMLCGVFPPWEELLARWIITTAHWHVQRLRAAERARVMRFRV